MSATIFQSTANLPFGLVTVTISGVDYLVKTDGVKVYADPRTISRTNSKGTVADVIVALSGEPNAGTLTLERAATTTALPTRGTTFSADLKDIGISADYVITNVNVIRSTDAMDELEISVIQTDNLRGQSNYAGDDAY
jgi:hypothetical protein